MFRKPKNKLMIEKNNRRSFLRKLTVSSLGVTAMPALLFAGGQDTLDPKPDSVISDKPDPKKQ